MESGPSLLFHTHPLPLRTLNLATAILALFATIEVVAIALTATVTELLAHTVAAVVEPFDLILGTRAVFTRQEAEFWEMFGNRSIIVPLANNLSDRYGKHYHYGTRAEVMTWSRPSRTY